VASILDERVVVVHYEQLVKTPDDKVRRICEELSLEFTPEMIEYGYNGPPQWRFDDQREVYKRKKPAASFVHRRRF